MTRPGRSSERPTKRGEPCWIVVGSTSQAIVERGGPMNIVVLVKQVPDTYSERKLSAADHTLDRESADAVLDEINERAVEEALLIQEALGGEVTVVCMGPERATDAIR